MIADNDNAADVSDEIDWEDDVSDNTDDTSEDSFDDALEDFTDDVSENVPFSMKLPFLDDELKDIIDFFGPSIAIKKTPSLQMCQEFIKNFAFSQNRTAKKIQDKVQNIISGKSVPV